jgi:hypothetical protein
MQCLMVTAGLGLTLFACSEEEVRSDLDSDGPPRVITVTATSEATGTDVATYCANPNEEKINANYCPTSADQTVSPLADTLPIGWQVRVIFNELLLADAVEELIDIGGGVYQGTLANTQPVTLTCEGQTIPYDGFYQPAGNHLTIPPGPALVIQPSFPAGFAATGSACEVTVKSEVQSKELEMMTQGGPYRFDIAPMSVYLTDPAEGATVAPDAQLAILFNAYVDANSLGAVSLTDNDTGMDHPVVALAFDDVVVVQSQLGVLDAGTSYTLTVDTGVSDIRGGVFTGPFQLNFSTTP